MQNPMRMKTCLAKLKDFTGQIIQATAMEDRRPLGLYVAVDSATLPR